MSQKILITSALPYANGPLHFGHIAGAYLPADCYARFERMRGNDVLYVCGSDEYGVAITLSAETAGRTPKEHVEIYHHVIKDLFDTLHLSFDHYSRTTWEGHIQPVQQFFLELLENGMIEPRVTDQLYSPADDRFLADRYVVGECPKCGYENARGDECTKCGASYEATELKHPRSKITGAELERRPTKHWFLLLDKKKEALLDWLKTKNWKPNVVNFIKKYIEDLRPRAITRDSQWGVPVPLPDTEGKVLYVWFDAPIGYISSTMEWAQQKGEPEAWKDYWEDPETKLVNFIGKDNIPFHAAIFPAMVMGQNQPYKLVDEIPANEFYKLEGRQFSKSDGWYIDLEDFFKRYSADQIRYAIAANAPETTDSEFTWKDFQMRCNAELLGKLGNFVNRVMVFCHRQCEGKVPERGELEPVDREFLDKINHTVGEIASSFDHFHLRRASQQLMELAHEGNAYFDAKAPWKDAKDPDNRERMARTLACCLQCAKLLAIASAPIIPDSAQKIWRMLGQEGQIAQSNWDAEVAAELKEGQVLAKAEILFEKIEDEQIEAELAKLHALSQEKAETPKLESYEPLKETVEFTDFTNLDLRVGEVKAAEKVPKSSKLLKLQVDLGFEQRQIISGIAKHYTPEQLVGMKAVIVANLKPAKIMGHESQGMLLAAGSGRDLEVITLKNQPCGAVVS